MMGGAPTVSPWGTVEHCALLCPGVYEVSTASHGGIMVRLDAAEQFLTAEARAVGFREGGYLHFEEDCDAPVALRELLDRGLISPRTDRYFPPGAYEACIDRSLQRWHPDYWQARQARRSAERPKDRGNER